MFPKQHYYIPIQYTNRFPPGVLSETASTFRYPVAIGAAKIVKNPEVAVHFPTWVDFRFFDFFSDFNVTWQSGDFGAYAGRGRAPTPVLVRHQGG